MHRGCGQFGVACVPQAEPVPRWNPAHRRLDLGRSRRDPSRGEAAPGAGRRDPARVPARGASSVVSKDIEFWSSLRRGCGWSRVRFAGARPRRSRISHAHRHVRTCLAGRYHPVGAGVRGLGVRGSGVWGTAERVDVERTWIRTTLGGRRRGHFPDSRDGNRPAGLGSSCRTRPRDACLEYGWMQPHFMDDKGNLIMSIHALVVDTGPAPASWWTPASATTRRRGDSGLEHAAKPRSWTTWSRRATRVSPSTRCSVRICTSITSVGTPCSWTGRWLPTFPNARYLIGAGGMGLLGRARG